MTLKARFIAPALLLLAGCGPTLVGKWDASGHMNVADPFDLDLSFQENDRGLAIYQTGTGTERQVPVCEATLRENKVRFVIDTGGKTTCATLEKPLAFSGVIGEDVISGDIQNLTGEKVGIWRAYRQAKK